MGHSKKRWDDPEAILISNYPTTAHPFGLPCSNKSLRLAGLMTVMPNGVGLTPDTNGVSRTDAASAENAVELDALYTQWKRDPASVDAQWNSFFAGFELGCQQPPRRAGAAAKTGDPATVQSNAERFRQSRVDALVSAYRRLGHQAAKIDPLNLLKRTVPELSLDYMKLTEADLDCEFEIYWAGRLSSMTLRTIIELLSD